MKIYNNPIHLVDYSPWPLLVSITLVTLIINENILINILLLFCLIFQWFRDIIREGKKGEHTIYVQKGLTLGFILFLVSEIMLFFSFFWAFFHSSLSPSIEIGVVWPPLGIQEINPWGIPLLGSVILLSSGFLVTLSHHQFLNGAKFTALFNLIFTILLGLFFLFLQFSEYRFSEFTLSDSVYGSVFYMTTGLHAVHVIIGLLFLSIQAIRIYYDNFTLEHHLGFEFALFYWHLVDVVWLFVFVSYYWWGSI